MNRLVFIWFVTEVIVNYGADVIASFYDKGAAAARAWSWVFGQCEAALAFMTMIALVPRNPAFIAVCLWGFVERSENAVCRLAFPMDRRPPDTQPFQGLCDVATGLPIYTLSLFALAAWAIKTNTGSKQ